MKCISLWQPWASLIAIGAKCIETRSWPTSYRGPLLIHAAKKWGRELRDICWREPFKSKLLAHDLLRRMPFGVIVCRCELFGCEQINALARTIPDEPECSFGDYAEGRFAWLLRNIEAFPEPIPYRGSQGFFDVPDDIVAASYRDHWSAPVPQFQKLPATADTEGRRA